MKDRIPTNAGRVRLTPVGGDLYDMTMADDAIENGTPLNKMTLLQDTTAERFGLSGDDATVNNALAKAEAPWRLLTVINTAGAYSYTLPSGCSEFAAYIVGGGGSGACYTDTTASTLQNRGASGGASGYAKNIALTGAASGDTVSGVIGAGGVGVSRSTSGGGVAGNSGGTTSIICGSVNDTATGGEGGNTGGYVYASGASGGQGSDGASYALGAFLPRATSPCGCVTALCVTGYNNSTTDHIASAGTSSPARKAQNRYDPTMVTLAAGGTVYSTHAQSGAVVDGGKGGDALCANARTSDLDATGYGNGGGALFAKAVNLKSGSGSDGAVLIYGR